MALSSLAHRTTSTCSSARRAARSCSVAPVLAVQASACVARSVSSQEQGARASFQSRQSLMAGRASMVVVRSAGVEPSGAPAGQITSELMLSMKQKIGEALETQEVSVTDVYGDGRHVSISVVSNLFEGKNPVQRQRMVYKAIWLELQEAVHAVDDMSTKTPAEAGK